MKQFIFTMLLGVFFLLLGCSGDSLTEIVITPNANLMEYSVKSFNVKAGQQVKLVMKNTATMPAMKHNVVILNDKTKIQEVGLAALSAPNYLPEHPAIITATPMADAGQTTSITFTAPEKPGTYVYICTFPGHYNMMQGTMIVN